MMSQINGINEMNEANGMNEIIGIKFHKWDEIR